MDQVYKDISLLFFIGVILSLSANPQCNVHWNQHFQWFSELARFYVYICMHCTVGELIVLSQGMSLFTCYVGQQCDLVVRVTVL